MTSSKLRRGPRLMGFAAAAVLAVSFGGFVIAGTRSHGARAANATLSRVSVTGRRVQITASTRLMLRESGGGQLFLLKVENGRNYYRIVNTPHGTCYGSGPAGAPAQLGIEACAFSPPFPSSERPVLDFSRVEIQPTAGTTRVVRIEGIAADAVKTVAWFDSSGAIITRAPVADNVYSLVKPPATAAAGYEALDASGAVLYRFSYLKA
jgi:hypothetical protein